MSAFSALLFIIRCRTIELLSELKRQADFTEMYFTRVSLCKRYCSLQFQIGFVILQKLFIFKNFFMRLITLQVERKR